MIILSWFIIGLTAGCLARVLRMDSGLGLARDIGLSVSGAILGGFMVSLFIETPHFVGHINLENLFGSLSAAILAVMFVGVLPEFSEE